MDGHDLNTKAKQLKAILSIGKNGVTDGFIQELDLMLEKKELIKVKLLNNFDGDAKTVGTELAQQLKAQLILIIGKSFVLYRKAVKPKKHL